MDDTLWAFCRVTPEGRSVTCPPAVLACGNAYTLVSNRHGCRRLIPNIVVSTFRIYDAMMARAVICALGHQHACRAKCGIQLSDDKDCLCARDDTDRRLTLARCHMALSTVASTRRLPPPTTPRLPACLHPRLARTSCFLSLLCLSRFSVLSHSQWRRLTHRPPRRQRLPRSPCKYNNTLAHPAPPPHPITLPHRNSS